MGSLATSGFDYDSLDVDNSTKRKLIGHANAINRTRRDLLIRSIIEMGLELGKAQDLLQDAGGVSKFRVWVEDEFGFSASSAKRYIFSANTLVALSSAQQMNLTLPAIYEMQHANDEVRSQAVRLANQEKVTVETVKGLKPPYKGPRKDRKFGSHEPSDRERVQRDTESPCPNCGLYFWLELDDGSFKCDRCGHPKGEPLGDADEQTVSEKAALDLEKWAIDVERLRVALDTVADNVGEWDAMEDLMMGLGKLCEQMRLWADKIRREEL